jgi:hypothetical protein
LADCAEHGHFARVRRISYFVSLFLDVVRHSELASLAVFVTAVLRSHIT